MKTIKVYGGFHIFFYIAQRKIEARAQQKKIEGMKHKKKKFENKKRKEIWTGSGSRKKGNNNEKKNSYDKKDGLGNFFLTEL